jgi:hypothetical protein
VPRQAVMELGAPIFPDLRHESCSTEATPSVRSRGRVDGRAKNYETVYRYCFQLAALFLRRHVRY